MKNIKIMEVMAISTIYKNRTTIPKAIRKKCNLHDGEELVWGIARNGEIIITKKGEEDNYF